MTSVTPKPLSEYAGAVRSLEDARRSAQPSVPPGVLVRSAGPEPEALPELQQGAIAHLARILTEEWEESDFTRHLGGYEGEHPHGLHEFILTHPDPAVLLADLGRRTLLKHVRELNGESATVDEADAQSLARQLLGLLGFPVPNLPDYSFRSSIDTAMQLASEIRVAVDPDLAVGALLNACAEIEAVLRATSISWTMLFAGEEWRPALASAVDRPGWMQRPTFGDWKHVFCVLPNVLRPRVESGSQSRINNYSRALKRTKAEERLNKLVRARNDVAHGRDAGPSPESVEQACAPLTALQENHVIPRVLQPLEERRDRYGRLTLRLIDEHGRTVEMFVRQPHDLTKPYVWFPRHSNPRDVEPRLLTLERVLEAVGS